MTQNDTPVFAGARNLSTLKSSDKPLIRAALQSFSGRGKTYSAMTFPKPVVLNFDNMLQAFSGKDVIEIPFWNHSFVDSLYPRHRNVPTAGPNKRDALMKWITTEGKKLTPDMTCILDSWTRVQDSEDAMSRLEPVVTSKGAIDEFARWDKKQEYARELLEAFHSLNCNTVVTFHETQKTDDKGNAIAGEVIPLMQGKFVNRLGGYFAEWYRCVVIDVLGEDKKPKLKADGRSKYVNYMWQTRSDSFTFCKTRMNNCPMFIPPHYDNINYPDYIEVVKAKDV